MVGPWPLSRRFLGLWPFYMHINVRCQVSDTDAISRPRGGRPDQTTPDRQEHGRRSYHGIFLGGRGEGWDKDPRARSACRGDRWADNTSIHRGQQEDCLTRLGGRGWGQKDTRGNRRASSFFVSRVLLPKIKPVPLLGVRGGGGEGGRRRRSEYARKGLSLSLSPDECNRLGERLLGLNPIQG